MWGSMGAWSSIRVQHVTPARAARGPHRSITPMQNVIQVITRGHREQLFSKVHSEEGGAGKAHRVRDTWEGHG